jgi:hypothetical protein
MSRVEGDFKEITCELIDRIQVVWFIPFGKSLQM